MKTFIDKETGEVIMEDKFVKQMLVEDIGRLFELSKQQRNLLDLILIDCKYKNEINIPPKKKKEYATKLGAKTHRSISVAVSVLTSKGVLIKVDPENKPYSYIVDPKLFFKGNDYQHVALLVKYSNKGRDIQIVYGNEDK